MTFRNILQNISHSPVHAGAAGLGISYLGTSIAAALLTSNPEQRAIYLKNALLFSLSFAGTLVVSSYVNFRLYGNSLLFRPAPTTSADHQNAAINNVRHKVS